MYCLAKRKGYFVSPFFLTVINPPINTFGV